MSTRRAWMLAAAALLLVACTPPPREIRATTTATPSPGPALVERLDRVSRAVRAWQDARDLAAARRAAEAARNLVVGPSGPYYGDADGDGTIEGASTDGLLPGLRGEGGIARESDGACVVRDVLGGSWADPAARWAELDDRIARWAPSNNTFPALPSHPQRIVGWATLALRARTVEEAVEYAGHARLHADVSSQALTACRS